MEISNVLLQIGLALIVVQPSIQQTITIEDGPIRTGYVGQAVKLRCHILYDPNKFTIFSLSWNRKNTTRLMQTESTIRKGNRHSHFNVLTINPVMCSDEGKYVCSTTVTTPDMVDKSKVAVQLKVESRSEIPKAIIFEPPSIIKGQTTMIRCTGNVGRPPGNLEIFVEKSSSKNGITASRVSLVPTQRFNAVNKKDNCSIIQTVVTEFRLDATHKVSCLVTDTDMEISEDLESTLSDSTSLLTVAVVVPVVAMFLIVPIVLIVLMKNKGDEQKKQLRRDAAKENAYKQEHTSRYI